jgi:O-antigen/teichoic acid export membrane protein
MEQKFEQKYVKLIIITLVMAVLTPALGVVSVILSENKAIAKIASGVLIQLICCGVLYIYIIYRGRKIFDKKYWSYGISFAIPLLPHYLSLTILNQSDRIMIANLEGQDKAAIYGVAYTLASVISLIFASINNSFGPWSVRKIKSGQYNEICLRIRKIMPCIVVIVLGLLCFEPEIILIFASKEYYEAIWVMPPITVGLFFTFINSIFLRVEFYYEMKYLIVLSSCIAAFLNIILNAVYIPQYGYYAAGYTTMICYLLLCVSHYFAMRYVSRKYMNKSRVFETGYIVKMSIIVILTAAIMYPLYKHIVIRYMVLIALLIILFIKRKPIIKIMREIQ